MSPRKKSKNTSSGESASAKPSVGVVLAAGGAGKRFASPTPKQFLALAGKPILIHTLERMNDLPGVQDIVVALPRKSIRRARELIAGRSWTAPIRCVQGGASRQASVTRGVARLAPGMDVILVHDAVRPLCDRDTISRVMEAAWIFGGAVPGLPSTDTIQRVSRGGKIVATPPREELRTIQTPQAFRADVLRSALEKAERRGFLGTDESSVVIWAGHPVHVVPGSPNNIKITRPVDLGVAEMILRGGCMPGAGAGEMIRTGQGIDFHRLIEGRKLILGGVEIPYEKGLIGHSDADVLCHAVCDALLGACGLGDIGKHFPDIEPGNRDRSSLEFLAEVGAMLRAAGWSISNVDATLLAQNPKLAPHMPAMQEKIAASLGIERARINIKATTTEGMNAEGRGEGISAQAVALVFR